MKAALTVVSVLTFLAWALLVVVGLVGFAVEGVQWAGVAVAGFYSAGLIASTWVGFFSAEKLTLGGAFSAQLMLLMLALLTLSGGLLLLLTVL